MLCKYKDILGAPNTGIHSRRIFGFALNDIIGTIAVSFIISIVFKKSFLKTLIIVFIIGELMHYIFCVDTAFMKLLKDVFG